MKKTIYILLVVSIGSACVGQDIQGVITDQYKQPISDVYVYTTSGIQHSHTDANGQFFLQNVSVGDTISISFLGYETIQRILKLEDFEQEMKITMTEAYFDLSQIQLSSSLKTINKIAEIDLQTNPVSSSQEVLRKVPGLFIGQHAGGGKAEQIFLRGFDIDHGTDIAITVDGLPVNMVSHAHGQGYADLHFLIPETIQQIDFGKGPYYTDHGNFNTAGYVDFKTKDQLDGSSVGVELGKFNTLRGVGLFDLLGQVEGHSAYVAAEYQATDGPVESPQNFNRLNLMGKYTTEFDNNNRLSLLASRFQSKWDASGQIPQRLVDNGTISRFGSVDDTEGGNTSRTNLLLDHTKVVDHHTFVRTHAFFSHYDFELYSNFTFFLEDPVYGDQIRQTENRKIYGANSTLFRDLHLNNKVDLELSVGVGLRYDDVDGNELSHTANRKTTLDRMALGDVDETNLSGFVNAAFDFGEWLINPGFRVDVFHFDYIDQQSSTYTGLSENKTLVSPKLNIIYNPNLHWQFYAKSGMGFHSNDTRVVVAQEGNEILPAAYGADLGTIWKPFSRLWVNAAVWYLFLEQEFVYVGDAGIVEPSGRTIRKGTDLGLRLQMTDHIFFNTDVSYSKAESIEAEEGNNFIPLAPELVAAGGLSYRNPGGLNAAIRYRYIKDRPANEDNSIVAQGYFLIDANAVYHFKRLSIGVSFENLLDVDWNEAQFATESRLQTETEPVEEIHFTPGTPFFIKGSLTYRF